MVGNKWLVVLPLLVDLNIVTLQPIASDAQQLADCCPCPDSGTSPGARSQHTAPEHSSSQSCRCQNPDDAEPSASILLPALRAMQPFVKQPDQKTEPKPLLQPEVGLASSVLETLRQATDEEYEEALARDAARSAVKFLESTLDPEDDTMLEAPRKKVRIFLNKDDMDDNLPEPSHIQETRCIHSPLQSIHRHGQLRVNSPTPVIDILELQPKPRKKLGNKGIHHRTIQNIDNSIGASDIKENVIQHYLNDNLERVSLQAKPFSLFTNNNLGQTEGETGLAKYISDERNPNQEVISKIQLKLRELIDNLEIRKSKGPIIDLNKNISPSTRVPPLQFKSIEKTLNNNRLLKNLLKLKDVELIPKNSVTKSTNVKESYPTLKLQSENWRTGPETDNCNGDIGNILPSVNSDSDMANIPSYFKITDSETSPTNSFSFLESSNEENTNIDQHFAPVQNMNLENRGFHSFSPVPENKEDQANFDYNEIKVEEKYNDEQLLSDYCIEDAEHFLMQQHLNNNNQIKGHMKENKNKDDMSSDESNNETFLIDFVEDFDTPIEFDNSSFSPKSHFNSNENTHMSHTSHENTLNNPIMDASNNILQENNYSPQKYTDKMIGNCNSLESFSKNSDTILENKNYIDENSAEQVSSAFNDSANDVSSDRNEEPSQVSLSDLQNMSDSILTFAECEPSLHQNTNTKGNFNEGQINDEYNMINTDVPIPVFETIAENNETDSNAKEELPEGSSINLYEKVCKSEFDESLNRENNEMQVEASEPIVKSYNEMPPLFKKEIEGDKPIGIPNNILKEDKHTMFLNNLKSKLDNLFSTTKKVNDISTNTNDNVNESSNTDRAVAFSDKLLRKPQTLFRPVSLLELPGRPSNTLYNNLASPNYRNSPFESKSLNLLDFPKLPFDDTSDPNSAFTALSDQLRSHTENTIKNVKETLESTLKDPQNIHLNRPTGMFDTHDILETISNRRDEMKEKLQAIHLDLNDRFDSFQQSVLDHFSAPAGELQKPSYNTGSIRQSQGALKLPKMSRADNMPRGNALKNGKNAKMNIMSSKIPTVSDAARLTTTERKPLKSSLYTSTTPIPSFTPRSKLLKTNIGSAPKLTSETLPRARPSKKTVPDKLRPLSWKTEEQPHSLPVSPPKIKFPIKTFKTSTQNSNKDDLSKDSPVDYFRRKLLQKNLKHQDLGPSNTLSTNGLSSVTEKTFSNRMKEPLVRARTGSRTSDGMTVSPSSHLDARHPSQSESGVRLVEPLMENVPYKCKLICYKET